LKNEDKFKVFLESDGSVVITLSKKGDLRRGGRLLGVNKYRTKRGQRSIDTAHRQKAPKSEDSNPRILWKGFDDFTKRERPECCLSPRFSEN